MNTWLWAAVVLELALFPCAWVCYRGRLADRIIGIELAGVLITLEMILLAQGMNRTSFLDLPLTLSLLTFGGGMVFVRFLQRWI